MVIGMLPVGALGEVDLGTYECADVTLETSTGQFIDDVPVYIITLPKGYSAIKFLENSKYIRVKVSGSVYESENIATGKEITRDSDLFSHSASDYESSAKGIINEKSGYDYLLFYTEKEEFNPVTVPPVTTTIVAYVIVEWGQSSGGGSGDGNEPCIKTEINQWNAIDGSMDGGTIYCQDIFMLTLASRSEERRVGKECRSRWSPYH